MLGRRLGALAALAAALGACGPAAEQTEARRMLADLERLRDASDGDRPAILETLERGHAQGAASERARKACTEAYRALHEATTLESSVRKRLSTLAATTAAASSPSAPCPDAAAPERSELASDAGRPSPLGPDTGRIVEDLGRAERELDRAKERMPACEQAIAALRMAARGSGER